MLPDKIKTKIFLLFFKLFIYAFWSYNYASLGVCVCGTQRRGATASVTHSDCRCVTQINTRTLAAVKKTFCCLGSRCFGHMVAPVDGRERGGEGQSLNGQMTSLESGCNWDDCRITQFRTCDGARLNINPYMESYSCCC